MIVDEMCVNKEWIVIIVLGRVIGMIRGHFEVCQETDGRRSRTSVKMMKDILDEIRYIDTGDTNV